MKIRLLERGLRVGVIHWALREHPEFWNEHTGRTADPASPHRELDDIWLRYANGGQLHNGAHESVWYSSARVLRVIPTVKSICERYKATSLGGVLMTRIPAGCQCYPHLDDGWHARAYEKFALQIDSAPGQRFCFEGEELETRPGDLFWFDNQYTHWVVNPTAYERVTMIVCLKR